MAIQGRFITGLLAGALIGASVAIVLVPASPSDMRDRLRAKANET
jgi:gas vesicle protein